MWVITKDGSISPSSMRRSRSSVHRFTWVFLWFALLDFVSGITRPLITWSVFGCYAAYRYAWFLMTLSYSQTWQQAFVQSWGDFDQALLQMVLSYWFGERVRKAVFGGNASHGGAVK